jgi:hypothetical protein
MALRVRIDFKNTYKIEHISKDLRRNSFETILRGNTPRLIQVVIEEEEHELLSDVYNLAFGPLKANGRIDHTSELPHIDYSMIFSTILFSAFTYLNKNPGHALGVDGSTNARAFLYYRMLQRNFEYLDQYFDMFGVKYYVRITRFGKKQYDDPFDFNDITVQAAKIEKGQSIPNDFMHNYFILKLKKRNAI